MNKITKERGTWLIEAMDKIKEIMVISIDIAKKYPEAAHQEFHDLEFEDPSQKEILIKMGREMDEMMTLAEKALER
jgi:hypothetical protein